MEHLMNSFASPSKIVAPSLTDEESKGLRDYWGIYETHREEVTAELTRLVASLPELTFILQNASIQPPTPEQQQAGIERQRQQSTRMNGDPSESLWQQGRQYAQAGLSFHTAWSW
jgi:hypothetical protein